jgi:pyruvate formate lyase activating enzyme
MNTALIFSIQKFSIHDGPGIRTTIFFKGCPLSCQWCHNPESQSYHKEILINQEGCSLCGQCEIHCSRGAIQRNKDGIFHDESKCNACEVCMDHCVNNAREVAGKEYTVPELMREIIKDKAFYQESNGGVTLSGGECMVQIDFVQEVVQECKRQGISVAIDTCGYAPKESFLRIVEDVDLFLYDVKLLDSNLHQQYTGRDNSLILDNLKLLSHQGAVIYLRLPLIEGINTKDEHIQQVLDFIHDLTIDQVSLLPYHHMGKIKYKRLNLEYPFVNFSSPSEDRLIEIQSMFLQENYKVKIGG